MGNKSLAKEIATFMWQYDYYGVMDSCGGLEEAVMETEDGLKRKESRQSIAEYLREIAIDADIFADRITAAKLYRKVVCL